MGKSNEIQFIEQEIPDAHEEDYIRPVQTVLVVKMEKSSHRQTVLL